MTLKTVMFAIITALSYTQKKSKL